MKRIVYIALVLSFVFSASMAAADTTLTTLSYDPYSSVSFILNGSTVNTYAGVFTFALGAPFNANTNGFCVEVGQHTYFNNPQPYILQPIQDNTGYEAVAWLVSQNFTGANAAAAQVAAWEFVFDALNFDLTAGNFIFGSGVNINTATVVALANQALLAVPEWDQSGYFLATNATYQDFVVKNPVPLPGAILLLGAGLARLVAYARRRQDS